MNKNSEILIAIADDHPIVRKGLVDILMDYGIKTIIEGANGIELIKNIEKATPMPNICMLDIQMPRMDGFETMKILNQKWPNLKTIVFTLFYNEHNIVKMISYGAKGYLEKVSPIEEIIKAINHVHEYGFYYSELEDDLFLHGNSNGDLKKYYFNEIELQFIRLCCSELTYKEIAAKMHASLHTIDSYRDDLFLKLQLKSRVGLVMFAIKSNIVQL